MGIVAKNAILLIDFAKWSEAAGMDRREALIEAGRVRLRPIFRAPLGIAVIGGVITSTMLTLLVIPTVYEILADWRDGLSARFTKPDDRRWSPSRSRPDSRPHT